MADTPYYLNGGPSRRKPRLASMGTPLFVLAILATNYWVFANETKPDIANVKPGKALNSPAEQKTPQPSPPEQQPTPEAPSIDRVPARIVKGAVQKGEIMGRVVLKAGIAQERSQAALASLDGIVDFRKSRVGDKYRIELNQAGQILTMSYWKNPIEGFTTRVADDGKTYKAEQLDIPIKKEAMQTGCTVSGNLYDSLVRCIDDSVLATRVIQLLSYDLSFYEDVREGDIVRFITERQYVDGRFYRYGPVAALEYSGKFATIRMFHFDDQTPGGAYFKDDGSSVKREFLRSPLQYTRVSSGYQTRRYHPVLHRYKKHLAIDYAAPIGTPVWTVADGTVLVRKRRGASGNLVTVRHANGYITHYAHLHRFAKNLKKGRKVKQGEIIGYVGATGRTTGPHLHYALRKGKKHLNPLQLKAEPLSSVPKELQEEFSAMVEARLKELEKIQVESSYRRHL